MIRLIEDFAYRTRRTERRARGGFLAAALVAAAAAATVPLATAHAPGNASVAAGGCDGHGMDVDTTGGYGMGPGMMGGWGGYGMGPRMMDPADGPSGAMHAYGRGSDRFAGLDLSDEQRSKISRIQRDLRSRQLKLMGELHDQCDRRAEAQDDEVASKADEQIGALRQQLLGNANAARKEINAVLTTEQRRRLWRGGD